MNAPRWAAPALAGVVVIVVVYQLDAGRRAAVRAAAAEAELRRVAEAAQLEADGHLVAERARAGDLERRARELLDERDELAAEVERLRRAAGARPVAVGRGSTGPLPVDAGPACLLTAEDQGEIRVAAVVKETRGGNVVPVVEAEAWRAGAAPRRLFGGLLRPELSVLTVEAPRPPEQRAGWGLGGGVAAGVGLAPAFAVSPPPMRLWGWQLELVGMAGVSPEGRAQAALLGLVRW